MKEKKKALAHQDNDQNNKSEQNDVKINGKDQLKSLGKNRHRSCTDHSSLAIVSPAQVKFILNIILIDNNCN